MSRNFAAILSLVLATALAAGPANASFHLWAISEAYSNDDGTVQYVMLTTTFGGQQFLIGHTITSSSGSGTNNYVFPTNLPGDSANKSFLIGTQGFAALGIVSPDYTVPNGFLFRAGGTINFADVDIWVHGALPASPLALRRDGSTGTNAPRNFAGNTGTVPPPPPPAPLFRAYLAPTGVDSNPCTLVAPCRLLPAALAAVADGGEVWMLVSANYNTGTVTVGKSVSILAIPGQLGSVVGIGGDALQIATAGVEVTLQNLNIRWLSGSTGHGINITNGAKVTIVNCNIFNFANDPNAGINANTGANATRVNVVDSVVRNNGIGIRGNGNSITTLSRTHMVGNTYGAWAFNSTAATTTRMAVSDSVASGNVVGFLSTSGGAGMTTDMVVTRSVSTNNSSRGFEVSGADATTTVSASHATANGTGFIQSASGQFYSRGDNVVNGNGINVSGTITVVGGN